MADSDIHQLPDKRVNNSDSCTTPITLALHRNDKLVSEQLPAGYDIKLTINPTDSSWMGEIVFHRTVGFDTGEQRCHR